MSYSAILSDSGMCLYTACFNRNNYVLLCAAGNHCVQEGGEDKKANPEPVNVQDAQSPAPATGVTLA